MALVLHNPTLMTTSRTQVYKSQQHRTASIDLHGKRYRDCQPTCFNDSTDTLKWGRPAQVRRLIEEENSKRRKALRRHYNETVRELAAFVRKRDKRVLAHNVSDFV